MTRAVRVKLDLDRLSTFIEETGLKYITVKKVGNMLGVSTRSAGKILARLEERGVIERYSNKAYRVVRGRMRREYTYEGEGARDIEEGAHDY